jgi:predicted Zn-dependent protease
MSSFKQLTDAGHLNRRPERISIKTISQATTLQQALAGYAVPAARYEDMAILNGMKLSDPLPAGSLLKIVDR